MDVFIRVSHRCAKVSLELGASIVVLVQLGRSCSAAAATCVRAVPTTSQSSSSIGRDIRISRVAQAVEYPRKIDEVQLSLVLTASVPDATYLDPDRTLLQFLADFHAIA